jgi:hypothetical protein
MLTCNEKISMKTFFCYVVCMNKIDFTLRDGGSLKNLGVMQWA